MNGPANSLRLLRIAAGVSVPEAASAVGMGESWLRNVERGRRMLTRTMSAKLASVYVAAIQNRKATR